MKQYHRMCFKCLKTLLLSLGIEVDNVMLFLMISIRSYTQ